jgi:hypothetical protein
MKFVTYAAIALILNLLLIVVPVSALSIETGHPLLVQKIFRHTENSLSAKGTGLAAANSSPCNTPNLSFDVESNLTSENAVLFYNVTGIASEPVQEISIDPQLYRFNDDDEAHAVLVFQRDPVICTNASVCIAAGSFIPIWDVDNVTGTYFGKGTVLFTPYEECHAVL